MLIGRRLRAIRWAVIGVLVGAAGIACALASAAVTDPVAPKESSASDYRPSSPGWLVASHPPRTVDSEVTLTATQAGVRLVVEHEVTLQAGDQLIDEIRSADVTGRELTYYLLGGSDYEYQDVDLTLKTNSMLPILEFAPGRSTAIARFGFVAEGNAPVRFERNGRIRRNPLRN